VADEYRELMVPAIERVWQEEIAAIARDLRGWLRHVAADSAWEPRYFELSFGLPLDRRSAIRAACPIRCWWTGAFRCAAPSTPSTSTADQVLR
jgi:hypothetical protein